MRHNDHLPTAGQVRGGAVVTDGPGPHPPTTPPRPGRPVQGSRLWWTRRVVLIVRLALVVLAVASGVVAATTEDTDRDLSNLWTVVMIAAIVTIVLGGLVWWVEPTTPPVFRTRERFRTVGRWTRALLAAVGLALAAYWTIVDRTDLAGLAMVPVALAPFAYLALTAIGNARTPPVWAPSVVRPSHRQERLSAAVAAARETLFQPDPRVRRSALTIRPRPGVTVPAELADWMRNGVLSTDGTSLTVTGRTGRTYRVPLAGPGSYGAAGLLVVREVVVASTQYGKAAPRSRELLCVLDSGGQRMLDIELYGWTRTDLVAFARAAGLRLDRYAPQDLQHAATNLRGQTPTALDVAIPKAATHRTVRGSSLWRDILLITGIVVVTVAGYFGASYVLSEIRSGLTLADPWPTVVVWFLGAVLLGVLVFGVRAVATWFYQRRQAARARTHDVP